MALAAPVAVQAQTQCTLKDATLAQVFPRNEGPLYEEGIGLNQAVISVSFPTTCPVRTKPLTVCLDLWDTTACPPAEPEANCDGKIRGSIGVTLTSGWMRTSGPTICNTQFLADLNGSIQHQLNFLFETKDDSVKADRQNYLIVHMHNPYQVLRIPIVDDD